MLNPYNCHTIQLPHREWTEGYGIPWRSGSDASRCSIPTTVTQFSSPIGSGLKGMEFHAGLVLMHPAAQSLQLCNVPRTLPDLPGLARSCQALLVIARSGQELLGAPKNCHELLGAARSLQELPEVSRSCQELPGATRSCQKLLEAARS